MNATHNEEARPVRVTGVTLEDIAEVTREQKSAALVALSARLKSEICEHYASCKPTTWEVCGLWLWVRGDSREFRHELKALGFRWSKHKTAWYLACRPAASKQSMSLSYIRDKYGARIVGTLDEVTA